MRAIINPPLYFINIKITYQKTSGQHQIDDKIGGDIEHGIDSIKMLLILKTILIISLLFKDYSTALLASSSPLTVETFIDYLKLFYASLNYPKFYYQFQISIIYTD